MTKVDCFSTEQGGVRFAAGVVYVKIGQGAPHRAVACRAGKERRITTPEHAPAWLTARGLSHEVAIHLVGDALLDELARRLPEAKATGKE